MSGLRASQAAGPRLRPSRVPVDDSAEHDARRAAEQVSGSSAVAPRLLSPPGTASLGRDVVPSAVTNVVRSPGQPLDQPTRAYMEPRFGQDFSGVRVHTDNEAALSARAVGARAYAVGRHVVFARDRFDPATSAGRQLLAHELAHVVQQDRLPIPVLQRDVDPETGTAWATLGPPLRQQAEDLSAQCGQRIVELLASQQKRASSTRSDWIQSYTTLRSQVFEADADAKLAGLQNRYDDLSNKMYEAVAGSRDRWSALDRRYHDEHNWLVRVKSTDAEQALKYLDEVHTGAAGGIPDLVTDDDYLPLQHVLERKEHIRVGELRATRIRGTELKEMMRTVTDLRRKGEDAEKFVPGWSDRVLDEARYLDTFVAVAREQGLFYAGELADLRKELLDRRQETLNVKRTDEGVVSKGYHLVKGGVEAIYGIFAEAAKEAVDLVQINIHFTSFGYYEPRFISDMAKAAEQGAGTLDLLAGMVTGAIDTPSRFLEACRNDDWEAIGKETVNLYFLAKTLREAPQTIKAIPGAVAKLPELLAKTRESVRILRARTVSVGLKTEGRFSPSMPTPAVPEPRPAPPPRPTLLTDAPPTAPPRPMAPPRTPVTKPRPAPVTSPPPAPVTEPRPTAKPPPDTPTPQPTLVPPRSAHVPPTEEAASTGAGARSRISPVDKGKGSRPFYAKDPKPPTREPGGSGGRRARPVVTAPTGGAATPRLAEFRRRMSRTATGDGGSPAPPPEQLWPITTVSTAAPPASNSGKPTATISRTRTLRRRVTTDIRGAHPTSTLLTAHRPSPCSSVNRRRYAATPPSSITAVATTNVGVVPIICSDTTRGLRRRSTGVSCARWRSNSLRSASVTALTASALPRPYANRR